MTRIANRLVEQFSLCFWREKLNFFFLNLRQLLAVVILSLYYKRNEESWLLVYPNYCQRSFDQHFEQKAIFNFFKENCLLNKVFWCASVSAYGKKTFNFNMSGLVMFVKHFIGNLKKNCNFYKFISKYLKVTTTIKVFTSTY